jgi:hypothetical protein
MPGSLKRGAPVPSMPRNEAAWLFARHVLRQWQMTHPPLLCFACGRVFRNEFNHDRHFWCNTAQPLRATS